LSFDQQAIHLVDLELVAVELGDFQTTATPMRTGRSFSRSVTMT
jgi:hypothetical protein